jgi:hypothetical protein
MKRMYEPNDPHVHAVRLGCVVARALRVAIASSITLFASTVFAQTTLGEVLDAGASLLNVADFQREIVQRVIVGQTAAGAQLEIMYAATGVVVGRGTPPQNVNFIGINPTVSGEWTVGTEGRICTALRFQAAYVSQAPPASPPRCQYWFKLRDAYFISDYDSDRSAKVLSRTLKQ